VANYSFSVYIFKERSVLYMFMSNGLFFKAIPSFVWGVGMGIAWRWMKRVCTEHPKIMGLMKHQLQFWSWWRTSASVRMLCRIPRLRFPALGVTLTYLAQAESTKDISRKRREYKIRKIRPELSPSLRENWKRVMYATFSNFRALKTLSRDFFPSSSSYLAK